MKLINAPNAINARPSPIINNKSGEKFAICVFAFAIKSVVKFTGSSIINKGVDGNTHPL